MAPDEPGRITDKAPHPRLRPRPLPPAGEVTDCLRYDTYYLAVPYTIADMICYPWTVNWESQGQDINEFKYFKRWYDELGERDGVKKGMAVGSDLSTDFSKLSQEEKEKLRKMLYNQRARPVGCIPSM